MVGTTNRSMAAMSDAWLRRKVHRVARHGCAAHPTADCQRSSAGSARAGRRRFGAGLQRSGISNASNGESRPDANAPDRSAVFSASNQPFDLNGEANRVMNKQSSAIIAVRRFGDQINKGEV